jgi:hypothetical protein
VLPWKTAPGELVSEALGAGDAVAAGPEPGVVVAPLVGDGRAGLAAMRPGEGREVPAAGCRVPPHPAAIMLSTADASTTMANQARQRGRRNAG